TALHNLEHRGAAGAEPSSGDGAGITVQVPDAFLRAVVDFELPPAGEYAVGNVFLPTGADERAEVGDLIERTIADEGLRLLGWRDVPSVTGLLGPTARSVMPYFAQLFVAAEGSSRPERFSGGDRGIDLDRRAFAVRKVAERRAREAQLELYFASLSARTLVY